MENKKICVALDTKNDKKNIIRTVNSVKRQTVFENIVMVILYDGVNAQTTRDSEEEIVSETDELLNQMRVVENLEELRKIVEEEYIDELLFINTEIVLAPNAIKEILTEDVVDGEQLVLNHLVADSKENYVQNENIGISPYCKLYKVDELFGMYGGNQPCLDHNMQFLYSLGKSIKVVNGYAYQNGNIGISIDYENEYEYIKSLMDNEDVVGIDVVTDTIEKILYKALRDSIDKENAQAFSLLQSCMTNLEFDDDILDLEYRKYNITPELFEMIGRCNVSQFRKMYDKFGALGAKKKVPIQVIEKVQTNEHDVQQLIDLQTMIKNLEVRVGSLEQEKNGYEVSQQVVGMYKDGKLGMGTIIKSIIAWIKYKLSGKR